MKKVFNFLVSTKVSMVLLLAFSISMAVATFIENDYGTQVARSQVYEAWWFEFIMFWLCVNFIFHIKKYKLLSREKLAVGLFHIAFIIIIIGAGITRFISNEGNMPIREGEIVNYYLSTAKYAQIKKGEDKVQEVVNIIPYSFSQIDKTMEINNEEFNFIIKNYFDGAKSKYVQGKDTILNVTIALENGRQDIELKNKGVFELNDKKYLSFNQGDIDSFISIFNEGNSWKIKANERLAMTTMPAQQMSFLPKDSVKNLMLNTLYQWDGGTLMVGNIFESKKQIYESVPEEQAEMFPKVVEISINNGAGEELATDYFTLSNRASEWKSFKYKNEDYQYTFGPKKVELPFGLKLNKFELNRYPGSQSPSAYASNVTIKDIHNEDFDFRIYMNNVLDYRGFRFYQASYDADEKGTLLAVNQDRIGTIVTYIGYAMLFICMILTLFVKGSRFSVLNKRLSKIKKALTVLAVFFSLNIVYSQSGSIDLKMTIVPQENSNEYGRLIVQDLDGRMKPLSTLAYEISRKLTGKTQVKIDKDGTKLTPEQFLLAVQINPKAYAEVPIFNVDIDKTQAEFKRLNIPLKKNYSFNDFLDDKGGYILSQDVERINRLKASERSEADKEILKLDERFNIFYGIISGDFLRLFPNKQAENNTWFTSKQFQQGFSEEDAMFVQNIEKYYLDALYQGIKENDFSEANEALAYISAYQKEVGKEVYPSEELIKAELFYTKTKIGNYLFSLFMVLGILLLVITIAQLFYDHKVLDYSYKVGVILSLIGLIAFTFDLGLRWYIAKHPPWSDGFEMLLFVSWGILLFGLLFYRKTKFSLPVGLMFSGILLFVSFLDWLNPEITNLMPVLHSYWLKIHVAVIVGSYAPLALAAVLALLSLLLLIFKPDNPSKKWWISMQEISIVNEMAITIGLFLLTIGTFLGGIWANESWGRYWAWDPKETWALISIIIYSIVLHLRLIPKLKNALVYNLTALWAFSSIIMTSYGVNYYLSGLHSYAKGDPLPIPVWVYWVVVMLLIVSVFSVFKYYKLNQIERKKLR